MCPAGPAAKTSNVARVLLLKREEPLLTEKPKMCHSAETAETQNREFAYFSQGLNLTQGLPALFRWMLGPVRIFEGVPEVSLEFSKKLQFSPNTK